MNTTRGVIVPARVHELSDGDLSVLRQLSEKVMSDAPLLAQWLATWTAGEQRRRAVDSHCEPTEVELPRFSAGGWADWEVAAALESSLTLWEFGMKRDRPAVEHLLRQVHGLLVLWASHRLSSR